ncbi:MAG: hypothetical protein EOS75_31490 [Mesorhizobium sp.]|nr:MAG: hypothetical protein EOS75_31490 [Mesorhizobium sp.]
MAKAKQLSYEVKTCFEITLAQSDGGGSDSVDFEIVATVAAPIDQPKTGPLPVFRRASVTCSLSASAPSPEAR